MPRRHSHLAMLGLFGLFVMISIAGTSSASFFTEVQSGMADKLEVTEGIAGMILGGASILAVGLAMSLLKADILATAIVLIAVIGILVGVGWLDAWFLILIAFLVAVMLASRFKNPFGGSAG